MLDDNNNNILRLQKKFTYKIKICNSRENKHQLNQFGKETLTTKTEHFRKEDSKSSLTLEIKDDFYNFKT